jgi:hypothetical protein
MPIASSILAPKPSLAARFSALAAAAALAFFSFAAAGLQPFQALSARSLAWARMPLEHLSFGPQFDEYFFADLLLATAAAACLYGVLGRQKAARVPVDRGPVAGQARPAWWNGGPALFMLFAVSALLQSCVVILTRRDEHCLWQALLFALELALLALLALGKDAAVGRLQLWPQALARHERIWLLAFSLGALCLYGFDLGSWRYAAVGDDYPFLNFVDRIINGMPVSLFSDRGVYGFNPVLSSLYQVPWVLAAPSQIVGWKLSSAFVVAACILPLYMWTKLVFGAREAVITAVSFAFCHTLLAFGHIGYNNVQDIFPFIAGLLCLELAIRKDSAWWSFLAATVIGLGCYTYYFTRIMLLAAPFYWLLHPLRKRLSKPNACLLIGMVLLFISPMLLGDSPWLRQSWDRSAFGGIGMPSRAEWPGVMFGNLVRALVAFMAQPDGNHFVMGGLMDAASAMGILVGLVWAVAAAKADWRARFLLACFILFAVITGLFVNFVSVENTRLQFMVPILSILAGVGLAKMLSLLAFACPGMALNAALGVALLAIASLNAYNFYFKMPTLLDVPGESYVVKYLQTRAEKSEVVFVYGDLWSWDLDFMASCYGFREMHADKLKSLLRSDDLKGKTLLIYKDALRPEIAACAREGCTVKDDHQKDVVYVYDFKDETYYNAFKELWLTGRSPRFYDQCR